MPSLHRSSERWLQALTQQNPRLHSADAREVSEARAIMATETEGYYRAKKAVTAPERLACWTRLRGLAIERRLWTVVPPPPAAAPPQRLDPSARPLVLVSPRPAIPRAPRLTAAPGPTPPQGWEAGLARFHLTRPVGDLLAHMQGPEGYALAHRLVRACEAEAAGKRLLSAHNLLLALNTGLCTPALSTDTLNALGEVLERRIIPHMNSVRALTPDDTWERTRTLLFDQQHLRTRARAARRPGLRPIFHWWPDVRTLTYYRAILVHAPEADADVSPATARFLRFLMVMEGPADRFWAYHPVTLRRERQAEHTPCLCASQKDHVARTLGPADYPLNVELGTDIDALVHGEYVGGVGAFLRSSAIDMAHAVRSVYKASRERGSWDLVHDLLHRLKDEACINGKRMLSEEFLVQTDLHDVLDVEDIVDLDNKPTENDKVSEYLRVFRRQQRRALATDYRIDVKDVGSIERHRLFESDYFNDELFLHYLKTAPFLRGKSAAHVRALVDYQIDPLCVIGRKPRRAVRGC